MRERKPTKRNVERFVQSATSLAGTEGYGSFQEDEGTRIEVRSKVTDSDYCVTVSVNQRDGNVFPTTVVNINPKAVDLTTLSVELSEEGVNSNSSELTNQYLRTLVKRLGRLYQKDAEFKKKEEQEALENQKTVTLQVSRVFKLAEESGYLLCSRQEDDDAPTDSVEARFVNDEGDIIYILDETLPDVRALHIVISPPDTRFASDYTLRLNTGEFTVTTGQGDTYGEEVKATIADQERVCGILRKLDVNHVRPFRE